MNPTVLLYQAAGHPAVDGLVPADEPACWLCGGTLGGQGLPLEAFIRSSAAVFEEAHAVESTHVCAACVFCFEEQCATLTRLTGRERPQKMRTYSHFVASGVWHPLTKADKAAMRCLLLDGAFPELAVISDSQQKHLAYRGRVNAPGGDQGWVQFEEVALYVVQAELRGLLADVERLYTAFGKNEIETGRYAGHRIIRFGVGEWQRVEAVLRPQRAGRLFGLAVWLAQRPDPITASLNARLF